MMKYEIHINGENNPFQEFKSEYDFNKNNLDEKMYIKKDGKIYSISILRVSHDVTGEGHVVRLHCMFNKLFDE